MTDAAAVVADQAMGVAASWSPPDAPASWWLTAATFRAIAEYDVPRELAAALPADRLPALLLSAAVRALVDRHASARLAAYYPRPGHPQPLDDGGFAAAFVDFCAAERDELARVCAEHRYQMTEVGRCVDVLPALAGLHRPIGLVDLGTGAGLGLQLDRYRYRYVGSDGEAATLGDPDSPAELRCMVRGPFPLPDRVPAVADRIGVDVEPLDLTDPQVHAWLAACVPPEIGAVERFAAASEVALAHPARMLRGDVVDVVADAVDTLSDDVLACLVDTYVHVFLPPERAAAFRDAVDAIGARRDLDWISVDPLTPLGPGGTHSVQGIAVPGSLVERNRREGVFGLIGRIRYRDGRREEQLLGAAHPGSAWLDWFDGSPG